MSHNSPPRGGLGGERPRGYMRPGAAPWMDRRHQDEQPAPAPAPQHTPAARYSSLSYMSARGPAPSYQREPQRMQYGAGPPRGAPRMPPPRLRPGAMPAWFNRFNASGKTIQGASSSSIAQAEASGGRPEQLASTALEVEAESDTDEEFEEMEQLGAVRADLDAVMQKVAPALALLSSDHSSTPQSAPAGQDSIMTGMQAVAKATVTLKALRVRASEELPGMASTLEQLQARQARAEAREVAQAEAEQAALAAARAKQQAQADLRSFADAQAEHLRRRKQRRAAAFVSTRPPTGDGGDASSNTASNDSGASAFDACVPASFQIRRAVQVSAARIALASEQELSGSAALGLKSIRKTGRTLSSRGLQVEGTQQQSILGKLQAICGKSQEEAKTTDSAWQQILLQNRARAFMAALPLARMAHCCKLQKHEMVQHARKPRLLSFPDVPLGALPGALVPAVLSPEAAIGEGPIAQLLLQWSSSMHAVSDLCVDVATVACAAPHLSGFGLEPVLAPTLSLAQDWQLRCSNLAATRLAAARLLTVRSSCTSGSARSLAAAYSAAGQQARLAMERRESDLKRTPGLATATSDGGTGANDAEFVGLGIGEGGDAAWLGAGDAGSRATRSRIGGGAAPATPGVAAAQGAADIHTRHSDAWVHQGGVSDQASALALLCVGQLSPNWMRELRAWRRQHGHFGRGWFRELFGFDSTAVNVDDSGNADDEAIWRVLASTHPSLHEPVPVKADSVFRASSWTSASVLHEAGADRLAKHHQRQLAVSRGIPQQAFAAAMSSLAQSRAQVAHAVDTHRNASNMLQRTEQQIQLHGLCRIPDMHHSAAESFSGCIREGGLRLLPPPAPVSVAEPLKQLVWPEALPAAPIMRRQWTSAKLNEPHSILHQADAACEVAWSDSEKIIFFAASLSNPKRFGLIASFLVNKTAADVISFYYKIKHASSFKARARAVASSMRRRAGPSVWEVVLDAARAIGCHTPKALLALHKNRWLDSMSISQVVSDLAYSATRSRISTLLARLAAQRAVHGIRLPLHITTPANNKRRSKQEQSPAPSPMLRLVAACTPQVTDVSAEVESRTQAAAQSPASKKARH